MINLLKVVEEFYIKLDAELLKLQSSCHRGCYYCCCYPIHVSPLEGLYVETYLESMEQSLFRTIKIQWQEWFKKCTQLNLLINSQLRSKQAMIEQNNRYFDNKIKCPFLVKMDCTIYTARPIICRTYFVKTHSELCKDGIIPDIESITIGKKASDAMAMFHLLFSGSIQPPTLLPGNLIDLFCQNDNY